MKQIKKHILILSFLFVFASFAYTEGLSFSGYAGGKMSLGADKAASSYKPHLSLQGFFSGQVSFTQNIWGHLEFSIDTTNLFGTSVFHQTTSLFQLDELSITFRQGLDPISNFFSVYMGTYDPIGSDIFLQRQFKINPITSMLTESWLGLAGSLIYPHFGIGISDVIQFSTPTAVGLYLYVNHEDENYFVFNTDLRFACSYRFFSIDFAAGISAPLSQKYVSEDVLVAIETLYWHIGTTMLIGNNYTTALFIQTGLYNGLFKPKGSNAIISPEDVYFLLEPRLRNEYMELHFTLYSLPQTTVDKLLFIHDTFGFNTNVLFKEIASKNESVRFGFHVGLSFTDKYLFNANISNLFTAGKFNLFITPYAKAKILKGELNAMLNINITSFVNNAWYKGIDLSVGYKTSF